MIDYDQRFEVAGITYGIEDRESPGGFLRQFKVWNFGCCIGDFSTAEEARNYIFKYAAATLNDRMEKAIEDLDSAFSAKKKLTLGGLEQFRVKEIER